MAGRSTESSAARQMVERALLPSRNLLEEVGDMMILTGKTISSAMRPPYPYGEEFVSQFLFVLRLVWFPLLVTTFAINYGAPGLQAANFLRIFGATDRLGGFFVLAAIREIGPLITSIVLAGIAGTAITADLGARKIREELDALQVLGVDPVKNLVVPRFLALMLITGLFDLYALLFGIFGGILAAIVTGQPLGPFWSSLFENATSTDLWGSVLKTTLFGAIIAIVCCYKGMTASGGAEGVGRAVNQAVVIAFLGVGAFNYVFTQTLLASWIVLPFMYIAAIGVAYLASYIAVVLQVGYTSPGGYLLTFWKFQSPPDLLFSLIKGMTMATTIVLVGCYYGYNASGGPVGVGEATAKSMVLNLVLVTLIGMLGTQVFWGTNPRAPIGG
jgi:phospholipid/cholesterol/gamma-HCH transport system permease protein